MNEPKRYWFPALQFGWGWGVPITWEGWIVFTVFIVLLVAGGYVFPVAQQPLLAVAYTVVIFVIYFAICYAKGEPTKWRWGGK